MCGIYLPLPYLQIVINNNLLQVELDSHFVSATSALFGNERYERFVSALHQEPVVSVRVNTSKEQSAIPRGDSVEWASAGFYLEKRPVFTADPLFHAGCYYVQEASSMFLEQVIMQHVSAPMRVLDLCAAPGGKSTHLLSLLPQGSLLLSNEPMPQRAQVLAENIIKWGNPSAVVTRNEPADFAKLPDFFDMIVVDAPCSGEGMFRKDSFAVEQWSTSMVKQCVERQRKILADVWPALRPGGLLVYSTCTFNREEDEDCVAWIADNLGAEVLAVDTDPKWGVTGNLVGTSMPVYRFIPGYTRGEGFFLSVLRKSGDAVASQPRMPRIQLPQAKVRKEVEAWLKHPESFEICLREDEIVAIPRLHLAAMATLHNSFRVLHSALPLAAIKNNKLIPSHSLAMSTMCRKEAFPLVELGREQALAYLHRETLNLPDAPLGVLLLTYNGVPIGFAKNVGNRANNMYPSEWRIRKNPIEL